MNVQIHTLIYMYMCIHVLNFFVCKCEFPYANVLGNKKCYVYVHKIDMFIVIYNMQIYVSKQAI